MRMTSIVICSPADPSTATPVKPMTGGGLFTTAAGSTVNVTGYMALHNKVWNNAGAVTMTGASRIVLLGDGTVPTTFSGFS